MRRRKCVTCAAPIPPAQPIRMPASVSRCPGRTFHFSLFCAAQKTNVRACYRVPFEKSFPGPHNCDFPWLGQRIAPNDGTCISVHVLGGLKQVIDRVSMNDAIHSRAEELRSNDAVSIQDKGSRMRCATLDFVLTFGIQHTE